jgi:hypothetical protein
VKSLPTTKRIVGGAARKRELAPVHHQFAENFLIKVGLRSILKLIHRFQLGKLFSIINLRFHLK